MLLADYQAYIDSQDRVSDLWRDQQAWIRTSILNVARMGKFSSDRSIRDYCEHVWNIRQVLGQSDVAHNHRCSRSASSMALMTSGFCGSVLESNLLMILPLRSIRNLLKFHVMPPANLGLVLFSVRNLYSG